MRKTALIIFAFGLLNSCSDSEKTKEAVSLTSEKDSLKTAQDTFSIGNKLFSIEKISKKDFDKVPEVQMPDTSENNLIQKNKAVVSRSGPDLLLRVGQNNIPFKNKEGDSEDFENYKYQGFFSDLNQHLILGSFIESFNYFLIDLTTGDTGFACGVPIISPDKNYFICGNVDLIAAFVVNGFDLYEIKDKKIKLIGRRELGSWGPEKIKWSDNSTLLVKRTVLDTTSPNMTRTDYVKLIMK